MWIIRRAGIKYVLFLTLIVILWMLVCCLFMVAVTYNHEPETIYKRQSRKVTRAVLVQPSETQAEVKQHITKKLVYKTHRTRITMLPMLEMHPDSFIHVESEYRDERTLLYGTRRENKGFMAIGIPTVSRRNGSAFYLDSTLDSLINNTKEKDKEETVVVVFMADLNQTWNLDTAEKLFTKYRHHCDSGFIQIIQSPINIYPNFSNVKLTLKDSFERVMWRSKQNIDFAFLMMYCEELSKYYLQLEDDVISAREYVTDIQKFIKSHDSPWSCLEFSNLGFIGKLFHSHHLSNISSFLLHSFHLQPCDILLGKIVLRLGQKKPIHSEYSLFQHIGKASSLNNKMMPSIDNKFKHIGDKVLIISSIPKGDNPSAIIHTNMAALNRSLPQNPYSHSSYFIARAPVRRQFYKVVFQKPCNVSRIVISTGDNKYRQNVLRNAELHVSDSEEMCNKNKGAYAKFVDGEIDTKLQGVEIPRNARCFIISVLKTQKEMLIIRAISVVLSKT